MKLTAYVRDRDTKKHSLITSEYETKENFRKDLVGNGYTPIRISNTRDLEAQEYGYTGVAELNEMVRFWSKKENKGIFTTELEMAKKIKSTPIE